MSQEFSILTYLFIIRSDFLISIWGINNYVDICCLLHTWETITSYILMDAQQNIIIFTLSSKQTPK